MIAVKENGTRQDSCRFSHFCNISLKFENKCKMWFWYHPVVILIIKLHHFLFSAPVDCPEQCCDETIWGSRTKGLFCKVEFFFLPLCFGLSLYSWWWLLQAAMEWFGFYGGPTRWAEHWAVVLCLVIIFFSVIEISNFSGGLFCRSQRGKSKPWRTLLHLTSSNKVIDWWNTIIIHSEIQRHCRIVSMSLPTMDV